MFCFQPIMPRPSTVTKPWGNSAPQNGIPLTDACISLLWLPPQNITHWVAHTTETYFSPFWRWEVQDQGVSRCGSPRALLPGLQMATSLPSPCSECLCGSEVPPLLRAPGSCTGTCPGDLRLTRSPLWSLCLQLLFDSGELQALPCFRPSPIQYVKRQRPVETMAALPSSYNFGIPSTMDRSMLTPLDIFKPLCPHIFRHLVEGVLFCWKAYTFLKTFERSLWWKNIGNYLTGYKFLTYIQAYMNVLIIHWFDGSDMGNSLSCGGK